MSVRKPKIGLRIENKLRLSLLPLLFPLVFFSCLSPVHELEHCRVHLCEIQPGHNHQTHADEHSHASDDGDASTLSANSLAPDSEKICALCAWGSGAHGGLPVASTPAPAFSSSTSTSSPRFFARSFSPSTQRNRGPPA